MLNLIFLLLAGVFFSCGVLARLSEVFVQQGKVSCFRSAWSSPNYRESTWILSKTVTAILVFFWLLPYLSVWIKVDFLAALLDFRQDVQILSQRNLGFLLVCIRLYWIVCGIAVFAFIVQLESKIALKLSAYKFLTCAVVIVALADPLIFKALLHLQ
jgi:hypothetical protein